MQLKTLYIKGFRNFKEVTCNFDKHSLIIGANDVGKTNLIHALRILLDKGMSDYDVELKDSDFYAFEETTEVVIRAYFEEVTEGCVVGRLGEYISDDSKKVVQYTATLKDGKVEYLYHIGRSDKDLDLHYVGITRAKKACFLVSSSKRANSIGRLSNAYPSEFLGMNGLEKLRKNL